MAKVLVVDDVAANRALIVALLNYCGHEVIEAADGAEALACVRSERPALVISDILMPTMDGFEFVRQLRDDTAIAGTEVIFYTAHYHHHEACNLARACGVSRVLVKPCEPDEILRCINEVLTSSQTQSTSPVASQFQRDHMRLITDKLALETEQLKSANSRLTALNELNMQIASEHDPAKLLDGVCKEARALLGAKYAVLMVKPEAPAQAAFYTTSGIGADRALGVPQIDAGPLGNVFRNGVTVRLAGLPGDPRAAGLPAGYPEAQSALAAPLSSLAAVYGWICLVDKLGGTKFTDDDERVLKTIAAQVGRVYENDKLYARMQDQTEQLLLEMAEREHAVAELRESDRRFSEMLGKVNLVSVMLDTDARVTYCNEFLLKLTGYRRDELLGKVWFDVFATPELVPRKAVFAALLHDSPVSWHSESEIPTRSGEKRRIRWSNSVLRAPSGDVIGTASIGEDTTEHTLAQERIGKLNRVLALISGINSLIVRVTDRDGLIKSACRLAIEHGRFKFARIAMLDAATGAVATIAQAHDNSDEIQIRPSFKLTETHDTLVSSAMHTQQPAICNDLRTDPRHLDYRDEMLAKGFRSIVALPLILNGQSIGCFVLITGECGFFDDAEMSVLNELSGDISFALDHIEKAERLNYLAYYDSLTGLANRTLFTERLTQFVSTARHTRTKFALVVADPKRFESINASHGRHIGDLVLKQLAERFAECVGSANEVARIGPDQFAAVLLDVKADDDVNSKVDEWWDRWLGAPFVADGHEFRLSAKAGIALYPSDGADATILLRNAESALRKAKATDDTNQFYTLHLSERVAEQLGLEHRLQRALADNEFVLHYQPKVDLDSRQLMGVEALIRWQSPELGLVPPLKFIPLMEETGMIVEAGAWALAQAMRDRRRWQQLELDAPRVAVNVSTAQLRKHDFVDKVTQILQLGGNGADHGIDIEVTESLIIGDVSGNIAKLTAIRDLGVTIAVDDFGTGYSSLSYLAKLPVAFLKIDRSFISTMLDDASAMTLVSTIISLAHSLHLGVVAEGVELEEQAKFLRLLGCDQMQGYLISKPLSFDDMTIYLRGIQARAA